MLTELRERMLQRRRLRVLASTHRAGQYARDLAWNRQWAFLRSHWGLLGTLVIFVTASSAPFAYFYEGALRWAVVGASAATGVWIAVLMVVIGSGAASTLIGVTAEEWTIQELRPYVRNNWRLVNGLKLRPKVDIDHIIVGPSGVIVLETKWAADAWPLGPGASGFMADRVADAVRQAAKNGRDVAAHFSRELNRTSVRAAAVLWSPSTTHDEVGWFDTNGVTAVRGGALAQWLETIDGQALDERAIHLVWSKIATHADRREARDLDVLGPPHPPLRQVLWQWVLQPVFGMVAAGNGFAALGATGNWLILGSGLLVGLLVGRVALAVEALRRVAIGWLCTLTVSAVVVILATVVLKLS